MLKTRYKVGDIVVPKKTSTTYSLYKKMKIVEVDTKYRGYDNRLEGLYRWTVMYKKGHPKYGKGFIDNNNNTGIIHFEELTLPETKAGKILFGDRND